MIRTTRNVDAIPWTAKGLLLFWSIMIFVIWSPYVVWIPLAIVVYIAFFVRKGTSINTAKERIKRWFGPFPLRVGIWRQLPKIEYLAIREGTIRTGSGGGVYHGGHGESNRSFDVYLAFASTEKLARIARKATLQRALGLGNELSRLLDVELLDET